MDAARPTPGAGSEAEALREAGYRTIDWIAGYLDDPDRFPVLAPVRPGEVRASLPADPPEESEDLGAILDDVEGTIARGTTHWNHPAFFAYFANSATTAGILGELFAAAFNVNAMLWRASPAATELEELALSWLRDLLGLPAGFDGVIQDTASTATLCALLAAREAVPDLDTRVEGLVACGDRRLTVYTSEQAHSSVDKASVVLGHGLRGVRRVGTDARLRLDPRALARAIRADRESGHLPFAVVATVGTTSTGAVDPVPEIARICRANRIWLHVDAAYAGSAAVAPEHRGLLDGCEHADSLVVNPHKWLFTPLDCSALYTAHPATLRRALSVVPEYLKTSEGDEVHNFMDYGIALGRRFRALKLWMVIRHLGRRGLVERIREHVRLAARFAARVEDDPDLQLLAPAPLSLVCFRHRPRRLAGRESEPDTASYLDELNERLVAAVNATGRAFVSHTQIGGQYAIRLAIGNARTSEEHVDRAFDLFRKHGERLDRGLRPAGT